MKKLYILLIAVLGFGAVSQAQTGSGQTFVQAKVATFNGQISENLEIGGIRGKNRVSIVGETFDPNTGGDREYYTGIKYAYAISTGESLDFLISAEGKVHLDRGAEMYVEPGLGIDFHLGKSLSLIGAITSPLFQGETPFKALNLKGGVGLQVKF